MSLFVAKVRRTTARGVIKSIGVVGKTTIGKKAVGCHARNGVGNRPAWFSLEVGCLCGPLFVERRFFGFWRVFWEGFWSKRQRSAARLQTARMVSHLLRFAKLARVREHFLVPNCYGNPRVDDRISMPGEMAFIFPAKARMSAVFSASD